MPSTVHNFCEKNISLASFYSWTLEIMYKQFAWSYIAKKYQYVKSGICAQNPRFKGLLRSQKSSEYLFFWPTSTHSPNVISSEVLINVSVKVQLDCQMDIQLSLFGR